MNYRMANNPLHSKANVFYLKTPDADLAFFFSLAMRTRNQSRMVCFTRRRAGSPSCGAISALRDFFPETALRWKNQNDLEPIA